MLLIAGSVFAILEPQTYNLVGMDFIRATEPNLSGRRVKVCVVERSESYDGYVPLYDYKPDTLHPALRGADITASDDILEPALHISAHSTAICSILAGSFSSQSANDKFIYSTPLRNSQIRVYEFWEFLLEHLLSNKPLETDIITAGFGAPLPSWWTRGMQQLINKNNIIAVASIGNGGEVFGDCLYPAAGANFIAVGIADKQMMPDVDSIWLDEVASSSAGITAEGLIKPDIVAPGNFLTAVAGSDEYISSGSYSSYAAPAVAAVAGVLVEKAKQSHSLDANNTAFNSIIKAILMNSAAKGAGWHKGSWNSQDDEKSPLDLRQGSGIVDAEAAYKQLTAGRIEPGKSANAGWDGNTINGTTEHTYTITPNRNNSYISATLVWNRNFSNSFPFEYQPKENINLRLELWLVDPEQPSQRILAAYSDSKAHNTEHIFYPINHSFEGTYEIVVVFSDDENADKTNLSQDYGIALSAVDMPKYWVGNWLDFDGNGKLSINDLQAAIQFDPTQNNDSETQSIRNVERMNGIRLLLEQLTQAGILK